MQVDNAHVRVEDHGAGDTVVVSSASDFGAYPAVLADEIPGVRVVTIQARGFGRSTHLAEPPEQGWLDQWGDDVLSVVRQLGIESFIYTGISHGGGIGWHLARRRPAGLRALVSVVGTPHDRRGDTTSSEGRRKMVAGRKDPKVVEEQFRLIGGRTDGAIRKALRDKVIAQLVDRTLAYSDEEGRVNQGMPFPEATTDDELAAILSTIDLPVLAIGGSRDGVISAESSLRVAQCVRRAKVVLFEDEGHFVAAERPERVVREFRTFLAELPELEATWAEGRR